MIFFKVTNDWRGVNCCSTNVEGLGSKNVAFPGSQKAGQPAATETEVTAPPGSGTVPVDSNRHIQPGSINFGQLVCNSVWSGPVLFDNAPSVGRGAAGIPSMPRSRRLYGTPTRLSAAARTNDAPGSHGRPTSRPPATGPTEAPRLAAAVYFQTLAPCVRPPSSRSSLRRWWRPLR